MYVCMYVCMYICMERIRDDELEGEEDDLGYACMYVCMHVCMYVWKE